jgi:hypothetical protein
MLYNSARCNEFRYSFKSSLKEFIKPRVHNVCKRLRSQHLIVHFVGGRDDSRLCVNEDDFREL